MKAKDIRKQVVANVFGAYGVETGWFLMALVVVIYSVQLWGVITFRPKYYLAVGAVGSTILYMLGKLTWEHGMNPWMVADMALVGGLTFLGFFLGGQFHGKFRGKASQYTDAQGKIRMRADVRFED
jgi:hypothetical protein